VPKFLGWFSGLSWFVHVDDVSPPYGAVVTESPVDQHVYLDANVIIDYWAAMNEQWDPVGDMANESNQQRIAAARLVFYGYRSRTPPGSPVPWYLVTSTKAREDIGRRPGPDLITGFVAEIDLGGDAPDPAKVTARAAEIVKIAGIGVDNAVHLAQADLRPWVRYIVTNDETFRNLASKLDIAQLRLVSVFEAVELLHIGRRETPPVSMIGRPWRPWLIPG
jgi:predicted nucleic acid-binding protein